MMNMDITKDFQRLIRKLPYDILNGMRLGLIRKGGMDMPGLRDMILEMSAELLRKKWAGIG